MELVLKGPLSLVTGPKLIVDLPKGSDLNTLAQELRERFLTRAQEAGLEEILIRFNAQNLVLVNGVHTSVLGGAETALKANDVVHIINFTHGG